MTIRPLRHYRQGRHADYYNSSTSSIESNDNMQFKKTVYLKRQERAISISAQIIFQ